MDTGFIDYIAFYFIYIIVCASCVPIIMLCLLDLMYRKFKTSKRPMSNPPTYEKIWDASPRRMHCIKRGDNNHRPVTRSMTRNNKN